MKHWSKALLVMALSIMGFAVQSCEETPPVVPPVVETKTSVDLNFSALWNGQPLTFCRVGLSNHRPRKNTYNFSISG